MSRADETVKIIGRMLEAERAGAKFPAPHEPGFEVCETVQLGSYRGRPLFEVIGMDGDSRLQAVVREDGTLERMTRPVLPDEAGRGDELKPAPEDPGPWPGLLGRAGAVMREGEWITGENWRPHQEDTAESMMRGYARVAANWAAYVATFELDRACADTLRLLHGDEAVLALWHTIHPAAAPDGPGPAELNEWRQGITNAIRAANELASTNEPEADAERREAAAEPRAGAREGGGLVSRVEDALGLLRGYGGRPAAVQGAMRWLVTALEEAGGLRDGLPAEAHVCVCDHVEGCEGCALDFGVRCRFEALLRQQLASRYPIEPRSDA